MATYMLTTIDNPYNPFNDYDNWYAFDLRARHNTQQFLARVCRTSQDLSEIDQDLAIQQAIDEIVTENVSGIYRKISENDKFDVVLKHEDGEKGFQSEGGEGLAS